MAGLLAGRGLEARRCQFRQRLLLRRRRQRLLVHGPDTPGFDVDPSLADCA